MRERWGWERVRENKSKGARVKEDRVGEQMKTSTVKYNMLTTRLATSTN